MSAVKPQLTSDADPAVLISFLRRLLARVLPTAGLQWLDGEIERQRAGLDERRLGIAVGMVGRKVGRMDLAPSSEDVADAGRLRPQWQPQLWGTDEAARVAL